MTMTEIDPKALEHACLCAGRSVHHFDRMGDDLPLRASIVAHARAIQRLETTEARHAAELREQAERFSEVAAKVSRRLKQSSDANVNWMADLLAPFIIPAPDPLVEVCREIGLAPYRPVELRAAIEKRGGKIVWEKGDGRY